PIRADARNSSTAGFRQARPGSGYRGIEPLSQASSLCSTFGACNTIAGMERVRRHPLLLRHLLQCGHAFQPVDSAVRFMDNESGSSAGTMKNADALAASRYRVSFIAVEALDLPFYLGSTLRGAFGHAFRRVACPALYGACPIPAQCPYHLIFETSPMPGSEALRTHEE